MRTLCCALLGLAGLVTPAAACPRMDPRDEPVTQDGATVYDTGGVIFTLQYAFDDRRPVLKLDAGGPAVAVAPMLSVVPPPPGAAALELRDPSGKAERHFTVAAAPAALAAPAVTRVTSTVKTLKDLERHSSAEPASTTEIKLAAAPPDDAYALIAYTVTGKATTASSWVATVKGQATYTFQTGGKACYGSTVSPTWQGETLRFAWLDRGGRVSAMSKPIKIAKP